MKILVTQLLELLLLSIYKRIWGPLQASTQENVHKEDGSAVPALAYEFSSTDSENE